MVQPGGYRGEISGYFEFLGCHLSMKTNEINEKPMKTNINDDIPTKQ